MTKAQHTPGHDLAEIDARIAERKVFGFGECPKHLAFQRRSIISDYKRRMKREARAAIAKATGQTA